MADVIDRIQAMLGGGAVLLPNPFGSKGIIYAGWQKLTAADVGRADAKLRIERKDESGNVTDVRELSYADELRAAVERGGNLAVLLRDGLCAIDIDHDSEVEPFLRLNPGLRKSVISRGAHGVQIWVRCEADEDMAFHRLPSWPKMYPLKSGDGRKWVKDGKETDGWGEWRTDGVKSTIWGQHPAGMRYEWISEGPVVSVRFRDIRWPEYVRRPWAVDQLKGLVEQWGPPWALNEDRAIESATEPFWAAWTALRRHIVFEAMEERFYVYEPATGVWKRKLDDEVRAMVAEDLMDASRSEEFHESVGAASGPEWTMVPKNELVRLQTNKCRGNGKLTAIVGILKGMIARRGVFERDGSVVHCKNCMIDLRPVIKGGDPRMLPFSPRWWSRNQIPVEFVPGAMCHELYERLLKPGYTPDEQLMLQRWAGQCLLGRNKQQVLTIVVGNAGGGKSTMIKLFVTFIGEANVMELRTKQLEERFEMSFYVGRTFLAGVDVDGDFLNRSGAAALKKLTGDDLLHAEAKGARDSIEFRGNFNIGITCNSRLKVRLKSDHDAWRRRLCIATCKAPRPKEKIEELERWLIAKEGPGILNWALSGAVDVLRGLPIRHCSALDKAVDDLINESDSIRVFARDSLCKERGNGIPVKVLYAAYVNFCEGRDWEALNENEFCRAVTPVMSELFSASRSSSVKDPESGRECKGYRGVAFTRGADVSGVTSSGDEEDMI